MYVSRSDNDYLIITLKNNNLAIEYDFYVIIKKEIEIAKKHHEERLDKQKFEADENIKEITRKHKREGSV